MTSDTMFGLHNGAFHGPAGEVELTTSEQDILSYLIERPQRAIPRAELQQVLGYRPESNSRALDRCVSRIRSKIELDPANPTILVTAYGVGYRFVTQAPLVQAHPPFQGRYVGQSNLLRQVTDTLQREGVVVVSGPPGCGQSRVAHEAVPEASWLDASSFRTADEVETHIAALPRSRPVVLDDAPEALLDVRTRLARQGYELVFVGPRNAPPAMQVVVPSLTADEAALFLEERVGRPLTPAERSDLDTRDCLPRMLEAMASYAPLVDLNDTPRSMPALFAEAWDRAGSDGRAAGAALRHLPPRFDLLEARAALGDTPLSSLVALGRNGLIERLHGQFRLFDGARRALETHPDSARLELASDAGWQRWQHAMAADARERQEVREPEQAERLLERLPAFTALVERGVDPEQRTAALFALNLLGSLRPGLVAVAWLERMLSAHIDLAGVCLRRGLHRLRHNAVDVGELDFQNTVHTAADGTLEHRLAHAAEAIRRISREIDANGALACVSKAIDGLSDLGHLSGQAQVRLLVSRTLLSLYETEQAVEQLELAEAECAAAGDQFTLAAVLDAHAYALAVVGRTREAAASSTRAGAVRAGLGRWGRSPLYATYTASSQQLAGQIPDAEASAQMALENAQDRGEPVGIHHAILGWTRLESFDFDQAIHSLEAAVAGYQDSGEAYNLGTTHLSLALAHLGAGRFEAARRHLVLAGPLIPKHRIRDQSAMWVGLTAILDPTSAELVLEDKLLESFCRAIAHTRSGLAVASAERERLTKAAATARVEYRVLARVLDSMSIDVG